jgi:hypothetical protein
LWYNADMTFDINGIGRGGDIICHRRYQPFIITTQFFDSRQFRLVALPHSF